MKVVLLAGGLGTRISEETIHKPKPMVEIGGLPILWHVMKIYSHYGINDFIICCGYKGYLIKEYFSKLNATDYLCNYYQKSIWKESEREYGKKQYQWAAGSLKKIKFLKDEGKTLCDSGKLKEGEAKLKEAIKIISHTRMK